LPSLVKNDTISNRINTFAALLEHFCSLFRGNGVSMKVIFKMIMVLATMGIVVGFAPLFGAGNNTPAQTVKMCVCGVNHDHKPAEITAEKAEKSLDFARGAFWTTLGILALGLAIKSQTKIVSTPVPWGFGNKNFENLRPAISMIIAGIFGTTITGINLVKKENYALQHTPDKASTFYRRLGKAVGGIATVGSAILLGSGIFFGSLFIE
jgi:hypothetical protein